MNAGSLRLLALGGSIVASACAGGRPDGVGRGVQISVAPLTLPGADEVCYGIYVQNGSGDLVEALTNICSGQYGNGAGGDISYVVPCDASAGDEINTVTLVLEGIDILPGANFGWEDENEYVNPCGWDAPSPLPSSNPITIPSETASPQPPNDDTTINYDGFTCRRTFTCKENEDVEVLFNLTVMRDADQGFFDIAVNFEDIFCSAKIDSCYEVENEHFIELLFDGDGRRVPTAVMAAACSAGTDDADTRMWMSKVTVTCDDDKSFTIDPTGEDVDDDLDGQPGNHCTVVTLSPGGTLGSTATGIVQFLPFDATSPPPTVGATCTVEASPPPLVGSFVIDSVDVGTATATATASLIGTRGNMIWPLVPGFTYVTVTCSGVSYLGTTGAFSGGINPQAGDPITADVCYAIYWGQEDVLCDPGQVPCNKEYWNLAINLADLEAAGLTGCVLTAAITASSTSDVSPPPFVDGQLPGPGQTYGYIGFEVALNDDEGAPECFEGPMGSELAPVLYGATPDMSPSDPFPQLCFSFTQGDTAPQAHAYPGCGGGSL